MTKRANLNVRISQEEKQRLREAAREQGRTLSGYVRHIITRAVAAPHRPDAALVAHDNSDAS